MLSVKQEGIKYYFLSLWYDSTWDWTSVSQAIIENSKVFYLVFAFVFFGGGGLGIYIKLIL